MDYLSPEIIERRMKTMKKKTVGILLTMTAVSLSSCGTKNEITQAAAMENNVTVMDKTSSIAKDTETEELKTDKIETEEPIYTDMEDLFLADNYLKVNKERLEAVDTDSIEKTYEEYVILDSTDLYNFEGTWVGYNKPNIEIVLFGTNDKWAEVSFAKTILYIPKDIFESISMPKELYVSEEETETEEIHLAKAEEPTTKQETTPSKPKTEIPASEPVVTEPSTTEPVTVEPEPVVDNTKYTPEEAIAVYRSIMEANGISWNPSLKNGGSWGTGWIYLIKGQPELAGNSDVESYRMGDGDGIPWRSYYLEVTGSDENAVYITEWHN